MYNNWLTLGRFTIHGYGVMIAVGILVGLALADRIAKRYGYQPDNIDNIVYCALIVGFIGAKFVYCLVNWNQFLNDPMAVLGTAGWVVYGGIIAGILAIFIYCRIKKISFREHFNIIVIGVALAQAFGRIGCFFAGCCYGRETVSAFGLVFPEGSLAPSGVKLIPTQLMSSLGDLIICIVLYRLYENEKTRNYTGFFYVLLYGAGRFFLEFFRGDAARGTVGIFSTSQFISICMVLGAGILLLIVKKQDKKKTLPETSEASVEYGAEDKEITEEKGEEENEDRNHE